MRQQLIKRLEEISPSPAEAAVVVDQLIKHLEAIKPDAAEAKALANRMKDGTCSESDRHRLMEILEAEEAALEFLVWWNLPSLPGQGHGRAKRNKQRVKRPGRHHRR